MCYILNDDIILQTILEPFCKFYSALSKGEGHESRMSYNTPPDVKHGTSRIPDQSRHQQIEGEMKFMSDICVVCQNWSQILTLSMSLSDNVSSISDWPYLYV